MKDRIAITGGSGMLALNWAIGVRNTYSVVLGLHKRRIVLANVTTQQINLESVDQLITAFGAIEPRFVVHTAGVTNVEECEANPSTARHVNVDLAANVAKACLALGSSLIYISTDHLFSGDDSFADETHQIFPKNVYAATKAEAELRVLETCPSALVIRTNFFCWGPSYRRSFSDVIIDSLRGGKKITLFEDVFFTPILSESLARVAHELIEKKASGVFNVVGDKRLSKLEFGHRLAKHFDLDSGCIQSGSLAKNSALVSRPLDMSLTNRKACEFLGRRLGGVDDHIARLRQQEKLGIVKEIQNI